MRAVIGGGLPRACLVLGLMLVAACSSTPTDATPKGALTLFLNSMQRGSYDPDGLRAAYELLDASSRGALADRARLSGALSNGREFQPWEMLVRGRFQLRFSPEPGGLTETITGENAVVTIRGAHASEVARVPMKREGGRWRVALDLNEAHLQTE